MALLIIEKLFMTFFTSIDQKKDYTNKDFKLSNREDQCRKEKYYAIDFWIWQKNKRVALDQHFQLGYKLSDGSTIVDKKIYTISVQKIFSSGYRGSRYKRELRIYTKYINEPSVLYGGDYVAGDKIGRDKTINNGVQINNIQNHLPNEVLETILKLSEDEKISWSDRCEIKESIKMIEKNLYSKQENNKLIKVLSSYIGSCSNVVTVIDFLMKMFNNR
ncbi:hypothetical protein AXF17_00140 [Mogibacterium pumilum]|uniref:Uncharacterized protein n=2 Tax=Mogibacterium pumilum TaxID=86332 RepID=A0A223AQ10_9FIRM|nr:hypothetical protein AXF17_00140 [Mogibacterium pumilum]